MIPAAYERSRALLVTPNRPGHLLPVMLADDCASNV